MATQEAGRNQADGGEVPGQTGLSHSHTRVPGHLRLLPRGLCSSPLIPSSPSASLDGLAAISALSVPAHEEPSTTGGGLGTHEELCHPPRRGGHRIRPNTTTLNFGAKSLMQGPAKSWVACALKQPKLLESSQQSPFLGQGREG